MSEEAKARLKGYLRTFIYMSVCGLLFVLGGGAFFIHESVTMSHTKSFDHSSEQSRDKLHADVSTTVNDDEHHQKEVLNTPVDYEAHNRLGYAKELRLVGFIFIGLGVLFICIGAPLTYQFWKRYQRAKEIERCPMLDPNYPEKLRKAYSLSPKGRPGLKRKKAPNDEKDSTSLVGSCSNRGFFNFGRTKDISEDSFRLATHHHPSFNLVPIEGLAALSRDEMQAFSHYSDIESEEDETSATSSKGGSKHSPSKNGRTNVRSYLSRFFGIDDDPITSNDVISDDGIDNAGAYVNTGENDAVNSDVTEQNATPSCSSNQDEHTTNDR